MKKTLTTLFLVLAICLNSKATNYYIAASGNDANNGTSTSTPWKTISKLNSFFSSLKPGDNVYLNRGDVFYGSITVNKSGNSGSPITIGAYGSGANPVITGFTTVSAWANLGGNIWESTGAVSSLSSCNIVVINGVNTPMGRYPNTGWLTYQSHSGTTSITSNQLSGSPNWTGAEVVTRIIRWILERDVIKSQSGGTLTFTGAGNTPTDGYGFFIQNDVRTLDAQNEWYYNPSTKKIRVYSTTTPTNVQVASVDEVILNSNASYITYDHVDFVGANSYLFENRNSKNVVVQNCSLKFAGKIAMYINSAVSSNESMTIDRNLFSDNNDNAMKFLSYASNIWIKNNTINNTGMIPGGGTNDQNGYDAIDVFGQNTIVEYNTINNTGHIALGMRQSDGMIARYNYISYFGMTKYDAGGIYSWNQDSTTVKSRIWDHNIVVYSKQTSDGIGTATPSLFGIYLDGDSKNTTITNNTVAHIKGGNGIFILNSGSCTVSNNTSYDNTNQLAFIHAWNFGMSINKMVVKNNVFFSRTADQVSFSFRDDDNTLFNKFGTADSNYYARPIANNSPITTQVVYVPTNLSVTGWHTVSGQDAHAKSSPKAITDTNDLRFEYNATSSNKTVSLPYNYIDVKNNSYNGSITLAPYSSVVLIKNGAATGNQPPTANAGTDQTINLPTSSVNLSGSGTDPNGTISSYAWTKISGPSGGAITNSTSAATAVTALIQGVYQFQLKVTDNNGASGLDTVQVTVNAVSGSLLPAVNPANTVIGINYSYYQSNNGYTVIPVFSSLTPVKTGISNTFDISLASRNTLFAFHFAGYINVPADGQYTFYTRSDDGSNLYMDNVLVVNNDGVHGAQERSGTIGLKAGKHAISVGYFQQNGGSILTVSYSGPGISKQPIPASALFIVPGTLAVNNNNQTIFSSDQVGIKVYPNPFADNITININGEAGNYSLMLADVSGKVLWIKNGIKASGTFQQSVNTSTLLRGVYFLKVIQNNNSSVIKLVK